MNALAAGRLAEPSAGDQAPRRVPIRLRMPAGIEQRASEGPASGIYALRETPPDRILLAGGSFKMGSTSSEMVRALLQCRREPSGEFCDHRADLFRLEGYPHEVSLASFRIDRTELSVKSYQTCVRAGVCSAATYPAGDVRFDRDDLPVTHVTWQQSSAYCTFVSGRLPTEAEWEYAARGRAGRVYPWGNIYNAFVLNHGSFARDEQDGADGFRGLAPVNSFADGQTPEGVVNLAGNVAEWVSDLLETDTDGFGYPQADATNPKGPATGTVHLLRGGSYRSAAAFSRTASRAPAADESPSAIGFRCVYDVATQAR